MAWLAIHGQSSGEPASGRGDKGHDPRSYNLALDERTKLARLDIGADS